MKITATPRAELERASRESYRRRMELPIKVGGMGGLGDQVFERPVVRYLAAGRDDVWLTTPYPDLWRDIPGLHLVRWPNGSPKDPGLRCQQKAMDAEPDDAWEKPPPRAQKLRLHYSLTRFNGGTIVEELEDRAGFRVPDDDFMFDLPDFGAPPVHFRRPYAVVRPVTVRREWPNPARAPDPEYVRRAAAILRAMGLAVVVVGDIDPEHEPPVGTLPVADKYLLRGELGVTDLMALTAGAAAVVGGVGWIVPVGVAYGVPTIIIGGGNGGHNAPEVVTDPRMDLSRIRFLLPDDYCRCTRMDHRCPSKAITDFDDRFRDALDAVQAREAAA